MLIGGNDILLFVLASFSLAIVCDVVFHVLVAKRREVDLADPSMSAALTVYGFLRMYVPFTSVMLLYYVSGYGVEGFIDFVKNQVVMSRQALITFLFAPFYTYMALLLFIALGLLFRIVGFEKTRSLYKTGGKLKTVLFIVGLGYIASITINALFAFGEEIGWRSFLFMKLLGKLGFWNAVFVTGVVWGLWHAPIVLILKPKSPIIGRVNPWYSVFSYIILCITLSIPESILLLETNSILPPSSLHGSVNAVWRATEPLTKMREERKTRDLLKASVIAIASWLVSIVVMTTILKIIVH
ncbi:CPBP family intramembrane metalloprotease [Desulfurococcaceae archaeon MEX13E-LK6-19]|nr:CPBP family intramembrane metalloprotease [Desulfurococcaceae archaeon MEX13E-LK6-19]